MCLFQLHDLQYITLIYTTSISRNCSSFHNVQSGSFFYIYPRVIKPFRTLTLLLVVTGAPYMTQVEDNLRQSGYDNILTYKPTDTNHQKHRKHKRKIIWFNQPFSKNVFRKIGKSFFKSVRLTFPKELHFE